MTETGVLNGRSASSMVSQVSRLVNIVLVLVLAYGMAQLSWALVPAPVRTAIYPSLLHETESSTQTNPTQDFIREIVNWHLFGRKTRQEVVRKEQPEVMPDTKLNLDLRGIVSATNLHKGLAIIQSREEESYFLAGQKVFDMAILEEIHADHIVLSRNGRYEVLRLPAELLDGVVIARQESTMRKNNPPGQNEWSLQRLPQQRN